MSAERDRRFRAYEALSRLWAGMPVAEKQEIAQLLDPIMQMAIAGKPSPRMAFDQKLSRVAVEYIDAISALKEDKRFTRLRAAEAERVLQTAYEMLSIRSITLREIFDRDGLPPLDDTDRMKAIMIEANATREQYLEEYRRYYHDHPEMHVKGRGRPIRTIW